MPGYRESHVCDSLLKGTLVWWCHHGIALEILVEPGRKRVNYIYEHKPMDQIPLRLKMFVPCKDQRTAKKIFMSYQEICLRAKIIRNFDHEEALDAYDQNLEQGIEDAYGIYVRRNRAIENTLHRTCTEALKPVYDMFDEEYPELSGFYSRETQELNF